MDNAETATKYTGLAVFAARMARLLLYYEATGRMYGRVNAGIELR